MLYFACVLERFLPSAQRLCSVYPQVQQQIYLFFSIRIIGYGHQCLHGKLFKRRIFVLENRKMIGIENLTNFIFLFAILNITRIKWAKTVLKFSS